MNCFRLQAKNIRTAAIGPAMLGAIVLLAAVAPAYAQRFKTIYNFQGYNVKDGAYPAGLVQGANGYLYGTTFAGGGFDGGTVFRILPGGTNYGILYNFGVSDLTGGEISAGLTLATNGSFYGITEGAPGGGNYGIVFKVTPQGALTIEHEFCSVVTNNICEDGYTPEVAPIQAGNGFLYGSTDFGGAYGQGTLYKTTPSGGLTTLYSFCSSAPGGVCADGAPHISQLVQAGDNNLYGTTTTGGTGANGTNSGTVFRLTPQGGFTSIYSFCTQPSCADGANPPASGLVVGPNGNLYGVASTGGPGFGTFFTITTTGVLTTLYNFCSAPGCSDGAYPQEIILGSDGNFYGTTSGGGLDLGTIFKITPSGILTLLHQFDITDGEGASSSLMQHTSGVFYGTTFYGGNVASGPYGTLFRLNTGLQPFVRTVPISGKVGSTVRILGTGLTNATSISFNGVPATFTVVSADEITATVPAGATKGDVSVNVNATTLLSNVPFTVLP